MLKWLNDNGILAIIAIIAAIGAIPFVSDWLKKNSYNKYKRTLRLFNDYIERLKVSLDRFPYWANPEDEISLRRFFVPINLMPTMQQDKYVRMPANNPPISNVEQILSDATKRHVVILGEPGSGKTTLLKNTILTILERNQQSFAKPLIPVFIRIKEWLGKEGKPDLLTMLIDSIRGPEGLPVDEDVRAIVLENLKKRQFIFFLDGLDEVGDNYQDAVYLINSSMQSITFLNSRFFISCRTQVYRPDSIHSNVVVETREFEEDDIRDFLDRFDWSSYPDKSGHRLFVQLKSKGDLISSCRNPLRLSILVSLYRKGSILPESENELYDAFCSYLISTRDIIWDGKPLSKETAYHILSTLFEDLAYSRHISTENYADYTQFSLENLKDIIREWAETSQEKAIKDSPEIFVTEIANEILQNSSLISLRSKNVYEFSHLTFQEFYVAQKINRSGNGSKSIAEWVQKERNKWLHPVMLYANSRKSAREAETLIGMLHRINLAETAGLCIGNCSTPVKEEISAGAVLPIIKDLRSQLETVFNQPKEDGLETKLRTLFASLSAISTNTQIVWGNESFRVISTYVTHPNPTVTGYAISALGKIRSPEAIKVLEELLTKDEYRPIVEQSLIRIGSDAIEAIGNLLFSSERLDLCNSCITILENIGTLSAVEVLAGSFYHKSKDVRIRAAIAFFRVFNKKDLQEKLTNSVNLPANFTHDEEVQETLSKRNIWPFEEDREGPVHHLIARAASLISDSIVDPFDPKFLNWLEKFDKRCIVSIVMQAPDLVSKFKRSRDRTKDLTQFATNIKSKPTSAKLFLFSLGFLKKYGIDKFSRDWSQLPTDYAILLKRTKSRLYNAVGLIRLLLLEISPLISLLTCLVLLIFRFFSKVLLVRSYGLLSGWELLLLLLVYGCLYFSILSSSDYILYREYNETEKNIPYYIHRASLKYPRMWNIIMHLLLFIFISSSILLGGLFWGIWLGLFRGVCLQLFLFIYTTILPRFRRDLVLNRINLFSGLVSLDYIKAQEVTIPG